MSQQQPKPKPRRVKQSCNLRLLRLAKRRTVREVAEGSGLSESTITNIERGWDTTLSNAQAIARFMGTTVNRIWPANRPRSQP